MTWEIVAVASSKNLSNFHRENSCSDRSQDAVSNSLYEGGK